MTSTSEPNKGFWLTLGFIVAFLAVGLPHWNLTYAEVSLPNSMMGPGLWVLSFVAAAVRFGGKVSFVNATVVIGSAAPAAILARVVGETTRNPTSHNLWPIECVIAAVVGLMGAAAGALLFTLYTWMMRAR